MLSSDVSQQRRLLLRQCHHFCVGRQGKQNRLHFWIKQRLLRKHGLSEHQLAADMTGSSVALPDCTGWRCG